jgi:Protein of unknown function (DUF5672)
MPTDQVRDNHKDNRDKQLVAIVTPLYRFPLTPDEMISIRHLRRHLQQFDRYVIGPKSLPPEFADFRLKRFPKRFFESIQSFSKLLVTKEFYRVFSNYEYILIYQTDCLVFSGNLEEWCRTGWDYVGAPWFKDFSSDPAGGMWAVGNGGLSLRKVSAALAVLTSTKWRMHDPKELGSRSQRFGSIPQLRRLLVWLRTFCFQSGYHNNLRWLMREFKERPYNEDCFWAFQAHKVVPDFTIPTPQQAVAFSFEVAPRFCFQQNSERLPFGCHAWPKYDREFWEPYLLTG